MVRLVTWNVQWCRGVDGRVDPARIARVATALDPDVLCLQEVARGFDGLPGSGGEDQMHLLSEALPDLDGFHAPATDLPGRGEHRRIFGNALFSRWPALQVWRHRLPWPPDPAVPSMQRVALEAVLAAPDGPIRVTCTHLEYYSAGQRQAQVEALRHRHEEACGHARYPRPPGDPGEPFEPVPQPARSLICGDFNCTPDSPEHARMLAPFSVPVPRLLDAWQALHPDVPHPPTWGVHDDHPRICCDFVFLTEDLLPALRRVQVMADITASDHQPVLLDLDMSGAARGRAATGCP